MGSLLHCGKVAGGLDRAGGRGGRLAKTGRESDGTGASRRQDQERERRRHLETIKVIVQALLIALVIRTFLFQPFNIPSGSLVPTLLIGDYLFVSKYSYGYSKHSIPFSPPLFSGPDLGVGAEARRHRRVQAAEGQLDRLHQARHRPAGRPHPGDRAACCTSTASR